MVTTPNTVLPPSRTAPPPPITAAPKEKAPEAAVEDTVEVEEERAPRPHRPIRKALVTAVGWGLAAYNAVSSVPEGIAVGLGAAAGKSDEEIRRTSAGAFTASNTILAGGLGLAVGGPVGLVLGAAAGYIGANVSKYLEVKSGEIEHTIDKSAQKIRDSLAHLDPQEKKFSRTVGGSLMGGWKGLKSTLHDRISGQVMAAGVIDGLGHVVHEMTTTKEEEAIIEPEQPQPAEPQNNGGWLGRLGKTAFGVVCGISGVIINAPGGAIVGAIESLKGPEEKERAQIAKPLMLVATNIGKTLPSAAIGALLGGPVGAAVGTAVGVVTASLTSIIDGKYGFNRGIVREVDKAVAEAHGQEMPKGNLRAYYRAGKGAVVGMMAGVKEGWRLGYKGGVEMLADIVETPKESVGDGEEEDNTDTPEAPTALPAPKPVEKDEEIPTGPRKVGFEEEEKPEPVLDRQLTRRSFLGL